MNIAQSIAEIAQRQPQAPALLFAGKALGYAALDDATGHLADVLAQQGIAAGDVIGINMETAPLHLITILALARLGAVSLSMSSGQTEAASREIARRYQMKLMVGYRAEAAAPGLPHVLIPQGWRNASVRTDAPRANVAADAPWRIALSSGTTGSQNAVRYKHADTIEYVRMSATVTRGGCGAGTRLLCFLGLGASFMLRPCMRQLLSGGAVVFAGSSRPRAMVGEFNRGTVTHAVMSPALLRTVCELVGEGGGPFPHLMHLAVGGAVMSPELSALARVRITPNLFSHYGANEAGLIALADPELLHRRPECAGRVMSWVEAQAVDEADRVLARGGSGALRFRGPGISSEYFLDPAATARTFRQGWFYPGDIGRIDADGLLFIEGRSDDRINLGGKKLDPGVIERVLEKHPQVVEAGVFALRTARDTELLCAAVVLRRGLPSGALLEHCRAVLNARMVPAQFLRLRKLPRNPNGKLLRRELQRLAIAKPRGDAL